MNEPFLTREMILFPNYTREEIKNDPITNMYVRKFNFSYVGVLTYKDTITKDINSDNMWTLDMSNISQLEELKQYVEI